jgi:hypothetical protein
VAAKAERSWGRTAAARWVRAAPGASSRATDGSGAFCWDEGEADVVDRSPEGG